MNYKREVLVSYLTELYGVEVTCRTLTQQYNQICKTIHYDKEYTAKEHLLNSSVKKPTIEKPEYPKTKIAGIWMVSVMAAIMLSFLIAGIAWIIMIYIAYKCAQSQKTKYENDLAEYNSQMEKYNNDCLKWNQYKNEIRQAQQVLPKHLKIKDELDEELDKCEAIRNEAYDLNIIPSRYRDLGSIAYLYEYFTTSKATDLDQIIQTMLMDDVRRRIQNIENQLAQIMSNQQAIYRKLSDIQYTAQQIYAQLTDIEFTQAEMLNESYKQTAELQMIKTSLNISNYLQAGTYLKVAQLTR